MHLFLARVKLGEFIKTGRSPSKVSLEKSAYYGVSYGPAAVGYNI